MVEEYISAIYSRTCLLIQTNFANNEELLELYRCYLIDKYESLLVDVVNCESDETVKAVVDVFIEDETRIWTCLKDEEIISVLTNDAAYDHLSFLSEVAFEQAKECYKTLTFYNDDGEYMQRLEEISVCLDKIKPYNLDSAKALLSETLLDIDYIFGKSKNTSLRLSRYF